MSPTLTGTKQRRAVRRARPRLPRREREERLGNQFARHYLLHPPKTNGELWEFIWRTMGFKIPRVSHCPSHCAPFDFVADLFFERVSKALGFANRGGGKTRNLAILNACDMLFKTGCEVTHAGATLAQAARGYKYTKEITQRRRFAPMFPRVTLGMTECRTGSSLEILTGTVKGLSSPHPQKSRIDEVELLEWETLQTGMSMSVSKRGIRAQDVYTSTRKWGTGTMQRLLREAAEKKIKVYKYCIWETVEKCTRKCEGDKRFGTCPILSKCEGKAHQGTGFYKIEDLIDKAMLLDADMWESEWLCERPSDVMLVYGKEFQESVNVWTWDKFRAEYNFEGAKIPEDWQRLGGIDFGASPGHAFACMRAVITPDGLMVFYWEYYEPKLKLLREHARAIKEGLGFTLNECLFADHDRQDRYELANEGVHTWAADKTVLMGIQDVKERLALNPITNRPGLVILDTCVHAIEEMGSLYRWEKTAEGKPAKEKPPLAQDDHCSDVVRYAVRSWKMGRARGTRAYKAKIYA